jgi:hypothetical protein
MVIDHQRNITPLIAQPARDKQTGSAGKDGSQNPYLIDFYPGRPGRH